MSRIATVPPTSRDLDARSALGAPALLGLFLLSLLPMAVADIPAMVDYPNHLARMSILARAGTAAANPFYDVAWAPYPNLAMDLLVPPLARVIGVESATKLFYLLSQALIVGGTVTLAAANRGPVVAAGTIACLFLYAMPFAFGFVNFAFAFGLALFALAAWLRLAGRSLAIRLAVHAAFVAALFFAHLVALGLYGFAIGVIELWRMARERPDPRRAALLLLGMAAPAVAVAALAMSRGGAVGGSGNHWSIDAKLLWLGILNGWSRQYSAVLAGILAIPAYLVFARGGLRLAGPGPWLAAGFALLFAAMPYRLVDTAFVDGRVLIAAILILPAFVAGRIGSERLRRTAYGILIAACLLNIAVSTWVQASYRPEYRALLAAFEIMPRGAKLLAAARGDVEDPPNDLLGYPMYHAATLAAHTRDAFVPTVFTAPGKQPLRANAAVRHLTVIEAGPIPLRLLDAYAAGEEPPPEIAYVANWTRDFDYLLLLAPGTEPPRRPQLEPIAAGGRFVLYRIRKGDVGEQGDGGTRLTRP